MTRERPQVVSEENRTPAGERDGIAHSVVFEADDAQLRRARMSASAGTGWHHHGDWAAYGVVLEGRVRFTVGPDERTVDVGPGEFYHVSAGTAHREGTLGDDSAVVLALFAGEGDLLVEVDGPAAAEPDRRLRVAGPGDLTPTSPLAGLTREMPFTDAAVQQVKGHADGRIASDWHHHGDNDVFGHVVRGEGYVAYGPGDDERELASAGDFFHVPAGLVHRDVNPTDDEQDYYLWLTGSEPRTVPVDGPP
jgi:quercetin dioxygenase-like cupin family protein